MLLREYETIYILRPDLSDDEITEVKERVTNIFSQEEEGHVLHQNIWGKKKLSYEIKKQPKGIFVHLARTIAAARKEAEAKEREAALAKAELDSAKKEAPAIEDSHQEQAKPQAETPAESSKEKE
jgi:ribosomal protein S6